MQKRWSLAKPISLEVKKQNPDLDPVVLQLLWNRGLRQPEEIAAFLTPDWLTGAHDPWLFSNMRAAVDRVYQALDKGEVITVHGDYDADGVCGTAVLVSTLREIIRKIGGDEKKITAFIPHRERDGYGMSTATMDKLDEEYQTKLVITVDCGISNQPAIDLGRTKNIDTIVCDHHTVPAELPESAILIHPQVAGEAYPFKELCGTAVGFKLASALIHEAQKRGLAFPAGQEKWLLDLVAIATVTDVMPLLGENRVLEHFGLKVLNKTRRPGLRKLVEVAGSRFGALDTVSIGFQIGPRLNAAGRLAEAKLAADLLLAEDQAEALGLAQQLHQINTERQKASKEIFEQALAQVGELGDRKLITVVGEDWPAGLVGLVAGKLASKFYRPAYAITKSETGYVGSGRGIEGFNVTEALQAASEYLDKFGGHPQACGFSTAGPDRLEKLIAKLHETAEQRLQADDLRPRVEVEAEVDLGEIDWDFYQQIQQLAPFGTANPEPVFMSSGLSVFGYDLVGAEDKHLRLTVRTKNGKIVKLIGFGFGDRAKDLQRDDLVDAVYQIDVNTWNGRRELQYKLVDLRKHQI
ncbi:single-stranded-DNA-specific exonuclease RecJ [Patescibacteria group bacterium]|nr:single-stranded-DNA-specific exonuclease RecJ [Patescibacteria group bacterium]MBU1705184.1 single-stranded-DNA-specific exonuclease RecJ [Patescibacteria group bacterium]